MSTYPAYRLMVWTPRRGRREYARGSIAYLLRLGRQRRKRGTAWIELTGEPATKPMPWPYRPKIEEEGA